MVRSRTGLIALVGFVVAAAVAWGPARPAALVPRPGRRTITL
jgi:hypothetical protein